MTSHIQREDSNQEKIGIALWECLDDMGQKKQILYLGSWGIQIKSACSFKNVICGFLNKISSSNTYWYLLQTKKNLLQSFYNCRHTKGCISKLVTWHPSFPNHSRRTEKVLQYVSLMVTIGPIVMDQDQDRISFFKINFSLMGSTG